MIPSVIKIFFKASFKKEVSLLLNLRENTFNIHRVRLHVNTTRLKRSDDAEKWKGFSKQWTRRIVNITFVCSHPLFLGTWTPPSRHHGGREYCHVSPSSHINNSWGWSDVSCDVKRKKKENVNEGRCDSISWFGADKVNRLMKHSCSWS